MTQQTILFVKSEHHVKRHQRHNKRGTVWSVVDHSANDSRSKVNNPNHQVPVHGKVFAELGLKPAPVVADYARLHAKHGKEFASPSRVRVHVEYTLEHPDLAIPATHDDYVLIVRRGDSDRVVCISMKLVQGKYRVKSAYFLSKGQLERKIESATRRQGGKPAVLAHFGDAESNSRLLADPHEPGQPSLNKSVATTSELVKFMFSGDPVLAKAEQLALFAVPVHVAGSTDKHGHYRAPHIAMRKKKMATPVQASLFGEDGQPVGPKSPKLDKFLAKHGGPARMAATLKDQTPEARAKLIDAMAHLDGLDTKAVMDKIGAIATSKPVARQESTQAEPTKGIESIDIRAFLDRIDGRAPLPDLPDDVAHAEGDKWVMPLSEAVAEHKELVQTLESPGKDDDKKAIKEQGVELDRMEAAQEAVAKEGDTKTEDGIEYRLQDGRWHRVTPGETAQDEPAAQSEPAHNIVEHVTAKGKILRGIVRTDLDLRMALAEYAMFRSGARKADPIKEAELALIGMKIPGYFPTPASVVSRMVDIAGIQPGMRVLEPSAGKGNIADAVRAAGVAPDVVEPSSTLRAILEAKGYSLAGYDFMDIKPKPIYDAVVMNPPFENGQDGEHVQRAYQFLKPGGTLVAVMSAGTFFRGDKKATSFRDWLGEVGGESEALPAGTFMESERQTGTRTYLVTIRKAESATADDHQSAAELAEDKADLAEALRHAPDAAETKELIGKVHAAEQAGPKEGDQKVEDGVTYTLRDGRWHRDDEPGFTPDTIDRTKAMLALHSKIEELGGKDKMADIFRGAKRDDRMKMQAEEILRKFGESLGMSRDETLAEFGLKETVREKSSTPVPKDTAPVNEGGAFDDLDPSSPTYRYRDTGYIAGSRKEDASNAIKAAAARGEQNTYTSIDWEDLEKNPRQAKEVITKSNLFGKVDWERLKEGGMTPAAGFLVDRVYAAIGQEPGEDTPRARQDYTLGLESLRARLEKCLTPDDVTSVLSELQEEYDGVVLNAEETAKYQELRGISGSILTKNRALQQEKDALSHALVEAHRKVSDARYKQDRRIRRGWKPDPELAKEIESAQPAIDAAGKALDEWKAAHPEMEDKRREHGNGWTSYSNDIVFEARKIGDSMKVIVEGAKLRNKIDNPLHRAWTLMGERFYGVLHFRRSKGSDAFAKHVAAAKSGTITDWSWAEKTVTRSPKASQESARFQLKVADNYERVGGRTVNADSTATIKAMFNLRDVQSGNWVLRDVNAAKFHVEHTAGAFSDLADLIGFPDDFVSLNGRLAMAFGARGTGAKGWAESAPRAHYEPVQRVINLTKNGGGGCLGHEWFHSLDNMIREVSGAGEAGTHDFVTETPGLLHDADMARAIEGLVTAMTAGPHRRTEKIPYTAADYQAAKYNFERQGAVKFVANIKEAGSLDAALTYLDKFYAGRENRKSKKNHKEWRTLAAAWYGGNPSGGKASAKTGKPMSSFAFEAITLDGGKDKKYWSHTHEMAARAFQSWCEDKLASQGRRNDYLSAYADNKYHVDPLFGIEWKPYPEGEERQRINAAFDNLFDVLRKKREMLKAMMALS